MSFPDGAPTHQSIRHDLSSSTWSLAYYFHTQNELHDQTNKEASYVIEPLSMAVVSCTRQLGGIRWTCSDNCTNGHYLFIVISLLCDSVSIQTILVTYVSVGMFDFSNYIIQ